MSLFSFLFANAGRRQMQRTRRKMDRSLWRMIFGGDY